MDEETEYLLSAAVRLKFPDRHSIRDQVATELAISLVSARPKAFDGIESATDNLDHVEKMDATDQTDAQVSWLVARDGLWRPITAILDLADAAVTRYPDDGKMIDRWDHLPVATLDGKKESDQGASTDELAQCAATYLGTVWARSPTLELWLARKMIFSEAHAFSSAAGIPLHLKSYKFWWTWGKSLAKWLIGLFVAFNVGDQHGLPVGILTYVVWLCLVRYLAQDFLRGLQKVTELFASMRSTYLISLRAIPCPAEIEQALIRAEGLGAIWPSGLRPLVARAMLRNPIGWA
ncbi:MAG: hypothetical protein H6929_20050 [Rhodoferax sp.]|nr:hypothetical protein [Rhodoferax sp.]